MNASPDAYIRSDPARFEYIHFVSHATASRLVPLDSAVILSPHGTPDSAKLYARDILSKPLHAELVTISACQGAGVREYAGEGLVGLAWAFLRAGSHNVIGALWDVSDASTPELMGSISMTESPRAIRQTSPCVPPNWICCTAAGSSANLSIGAPFSFTPQGQ